MAKNEGVFRACGRDDLIAPNNDNPSGASRHLPLHKGGFGSSAPAGAGSGFPRQ